MKKNIICALLILALCFSTTLGVFAAPGEGESNPAPATEQTGGNSAGEQEQPVAPADKPAAEEKADNPENAEQAENTEATAEEDKEPVDVVGLIKLILQSVWAVSVLVLLILILAKSAKKSELAKLDKKVKENGVICTEASSRISTLQMDLTSMKLQIDGVGRTLEFALNNQPKVVEKVEPVAPKRVLSFEEQVNEALSSGNMATLGLYAVDICSSGGMIEVNTTSNTANASFFCKENGDEILVYPAGKIKERVWDAVYAPWFDISRNSDAGTMVSLIKPLTLKNNSTSGRIDLINKGMITIM